MEPILPPLLMLPRLPANEADVLRWAADVNSVLRELYQSVADRVDSLTMHGDVATERPAAEGLRRLFLDEASQALSFELPTGWVAPVAGGGAHHGSHENLGADEISVAGLSGELADAQPPKVHAASHQNAGADEISVAGLSGELADAQPAKAHTHGGGDVTSAVAAATNADTVDSFHGAEFETRFLAWFAGTGQQVRRYKPKALGYRIPYQSDGSLRFYLPVDYPEYTAIMIRFRYSGPLGFDGYIAGGCYAYGWSAAMISPWTAVRMAKQTSTGKAVLWLGPAMTYCGSGGYRLEVDEIIVYCSSEADLAQFDVDDSCGITIGDASSDADLTFYGDQGEAPVVVPVNKVWGSAGSSSNFAWFVGTNDFSAATYPGVNAFTLVGPPELTTGDTAGIRLEVILMPAGYIYSTRVFIDIACSYNYTAARAWMDAATVPYFDDTGIRVGFAGNRLKVIFGNPATSNPYYFKVVGLRVVAHTLSHLNWTYEFNATEPTWQTDGYGNLRKVIINPLPVVVKSDDSRLTDARTPTAHATSHQNTGADEINVAGLSGELADAQPPKAHTHGGGDVTSQVASAAAADAVPWTGVSGKPSTFTPEAHAASHQNAGADEINVAGLSGELADAQPPKAHTHGGGDVTSQVASAAAADAVPWTGVSGKPSTFTPEAHAASHQNAGADEISVAGLSGELADPQPPKAHHLTHEAGGADEVVGLRSVNVGGVLTKNLTVGTTGTVALSLGYSLGDTTQISADAVPAGIKLDDLGTPDDNTDLDASTTRHGLLPKLDGSAAKVLLGDGTWGSGQMQGFAIFVSDPVVETGDATRIGTASATKCVGAVVVTVPTGATIIAAWARFVGRVRNSSGSVNGFDTTTGGNIAVKKGAGAFTSFGSLTNVLANTPASVTVGGIAIAENDIRSVLTGSDTYTLEFKDAAAVANYLYFDGHWEVGVVFTAA